MPNVLMSLFFIHNTRKSSYSLHPHIMPSVIVCETVKRKRTAKAAQVRLFGKIVKSFKNFKRIGGIEINIIEITHNIPPLNIKRCKA